MDRHTNKYFTDRQNDFESSARSYPRKFPVALTKAKGSWVEDADGKRYLDFLCGAGTLALGHNDDELLQVPEDALGFQPLNVYPSRVGVGSEEI